MTCRRRKMSENEKKHLLPNFYRFIQKRPDYQKQWTPPSDVMTRERLSVIGVLFVFSFLNLFFAAYSSPFYRYSPYTDANIYMAVARAMQNGLLPYRDVFDHKGLLLYFIYYMGSLIDRSGFLGIYVVLSLSFSIFLYYGYLLSRLFFRPMVSIFAAFSLAFVSVASPIYINGGGSTEELMMPFIMVCLYYMVRDLHQIDHRDSIASRNRAFGYFLIGIACGAILWIKFSSLIVVGFPGLFLIGVLITKRRFKDLFISAVSFLLGMAIISLPSVLYLARHDLFSEFSEVYIRFNYAYSSLMLDTEIEMFVEMLFLGCILPCVPVIIALRYLSKKIRTVNRLTVVFSGVHMLSLLFLYIIGKKNYPYYFLQTGPVFIFASSAVMYFLSRSFANRKAKYKSSIILISFSLMILSVTMLFSTVRWQLGSPVAGPSSVEICAQEINMTWSNQDVKRSPNIILLDTSDQGYYELCNTYPQERYFYVPNTSMEKRLEIIEAQKTYIRSQRVDFVIMYVKTDRVLDFSDLHSEFQRMVCLPSDTDEGYFWQIYTQSAEKSSLE